MSEAFWNIFWNIVGGIIVVLLTFAYQRIVHYVSHRAFRQVVGDDLHELYVVYPACQTPNIATVYPKPQPMVPRRVFGTVNLTMLNSTAITRSVSHIAFAISRFSGSSPQIRSDLEMDELMDISFLSVGGVNNFKSLDVLDNGSNSFLTFGERGSITSQNSDREIVRIEGANDYGLILKIRPDHNSQRTWLCVAGIGEWGTSGAAWWLGRHWKTIHKQAKDKPFACITRTRFGSDDSTALVHLFLSSEDVERVAGTTPNQPPEQGRAR